MDVGKVPFEDKPRYVSKGKPMLRHSGGLASLRRRPSEEFSL